MGHLRAYYERFVQLKPSEWEFIAAHFTRKVFSKNEIITRQGDTEQFLSFIESGIVRFLFPAKRTNLHFSFASTSNSPVHTIPSLRKRPLPMLCRRSQKPLFGVYRMKTFRKCMPKPMPATCWDALLRKNCSWRKVKENCRCCNTMPKNATCNYCMNNPKSCNKFL